MSDEILPDAYKSFFGSLIRFLALNIIQVPFSPTDVTVTVVSGSRLEVRRLCFVAK